jgi:hypothetical protein
MGLTVTNSGATYTYNGTVPRTFNVSWFVNWSSDSANARVTWLFVNGANGQNRFGYYNTQAANTQPTFLASATTITLTNNDFFEIYTWQNSGNTLTLNGSGGGASAGYAGRIQITML